MIEKKKKKKNISKEKKTMKKINNARYVVKKSVILLYPNPIHSNRTKRYVYDLFLCYSIQLFIQLIGSPNIMRGVSIEKYV